MSSEQIPTLDDVQQSFRQCAPLFHALGDKQRQDIIMLLAETERMNVSAITEKMPLSRPAISHHLKVLLQAGLVKVESESRENFYSLTLDEGLMQLKQLVMRAEQSCV